MTYKEIEMNGANYIMTEQIAKILNSSRIIAKNKYRPITLDEHETALEHDERMREKRHKENCINMFMNGVIGFIRDYYKTIGVIK